MRAFIAVDFSKKIQEELIKIQKSIKKLGLIKAKFVEPENLHLTLKFLGEISEKQADEIKIRLDGIGLKKFPAKFEEIGVFSEKYVRIVWLKLGGEGIFNLQGIIDDRLADLFPPESRFMSHVTLIRPKALDDRKAFIANLKKIKLNIPEFVVDSFSFKKSQLTPKGAIYTTIKDYKLE